MHIAEVVEIALANCDERRVEVAALEPASVTIEAVGGLTPLLSELVDNAIAFSEPDDRVRVTGLFDQDDYLITISDRGVGIPEHLSDVLNTMLEDPDARVGIEPTLGIALVARLAARHGIGVRLVPGVPGTTARVTVPSNLAGRVGVGEEEMPAAEEHRLPEREGPPVFAEPGGVGKRVGISLFERRPWTGSGVVAMSEEAKLEAEAFLEKVFSQLMKQPAGIDRPPAETPSNGNGRPLEPGIEMRPETSPKPAGQVTSLRTRVPGENFSPIDDDPSTVAAEGAIDIRSALTSYEEGRRSAEQTDRDDPEGVGPPDG